jgi:uncharacterized protein YodC (DUF2158 family)
MTVGNETTDTGFVLCVWFDKQGQIIQRKFLKGLLKKVGF